MKVTGKRFTFAVDGHVRVGMAPFVAPRPQKRQVSQAAHRSAEPGVVRPTPQGLEDRLDSASFGTGIDSAKGGV